MTKFHLFFNDGYDEIVGPSPESPFIAYTDRFQELVARHGQPYDYKVIEEEEYDSDRSKDHTEQT